MTTQQEPVKRVRLDTETHRKAKIAAVTAGIDLEKWVAAAIAEKYAREVKVTR